MDKLYTLGWSRYFQQIWLEQNFSTNYQIGRIGIEYNNYYTVHTTRGDMLAEAAGKLLYLAHDKHELPKVGDWVALTVFADENKGIIHHILPRRTVLSRKTAGDRIEEQIIATNLDTVFIVQGLDDNYNLRRIERYLSMIYSGGINPVVILNKSDLDPLADKHLDAVHQIAQQVPVLLTSCLTMQGIDELKKFIQKGKSYAFIGSSGAGKSSLINSVVGKPIQETVPVRTADSKGRHTTTRREMIVLPAGGILIDTPGMRELQIWDVEEGIKETFEDIEALAAHCHFSDCQHISEIKCAVKQAVASGALPQKRYENYIKMLKEQHYLESRLSEHTIIAERQRKKKMEKTYKRDAKMIKNKKRSHS